MQFIDAHLILYQLADPRVVSYVEMDGRICILKIACILEIKEYVFYNYLMICGRMMHKFLYPGDFGAHDY